VDAIDRLIDAHGPAVVTAILEPMLTPERIARIDVVLAARLESVIPIVEDTHDPHNAAAAIRTTDALGLCELHVIEPAERFSASSGVTRGSHKWIELRRHACANDAVAALHARGFVVYATSAAAPLSIDDVPIDRPIAVAFGNEHAGLTAEAVAACDGALAVPMFGFVESLNLSVTVALAMSTLAKRRRTYLGATGDLSRERRERLRARWIALKIRAAVGIVERALG
jgi:tRNA (guanosine-2'-O-)-methyltransferase